MPCFTIYIFMYKDDSFLGHNDFLLHPSTTIIITSITIFIILPYVNSTQLQQVTQQHEKDTIFTHCKMILIQDNPPSKTCLPRENDFICI